MTARGARLSSVAQDGPAARAGLRAGDVVARIGDRATVTEGSVASAVAAHPPGARVAIRVLRDGRERTLTARLGAQPRQR